MNPSEIPEKILNQMARDKRVSEGELEALKLALRRRKSKDIAQQLDISEAAARKRLGEVYKKFGIKGKGPGKLAFLEAELGARLVDYDYDASEMTGDAVGEWGKDWERDLLSAGHIKHGLEGESGLLSGLSLSLPLTEANLAGSHLAGSHPSDAASFASSEGSGADLGAGITDDWRDAPEVSSFQGRCESLEELESWLVKPTNTPKLLAICGIGGIGKSYLARKLAETVGDNFQKVLWLSIDPSKPAGDVLRSLKTMLQAQPLVQPLAQPPAQPLTLPLNRSRWTEAEPSSAEMKASRQQALRSKHESSDLLVRQIAALVVRQSVLIIFDGFDNIFKGYSSDEAISTAAAPTFEVTRKQQASLYQAGFEVYGKLLTTLKRCKNLKGLSPASCFILTSREKPKELFSFAADDANRKLYMLEGLAHSEAEALLKRFHLSGQPKDYREFIDRYCGHPMALRLSANTVKDVFDGSVRDFLKQEISVFDDLRSLLKTQFERLPPTEKEVMYWLAVNHQPCSLDDFKKDIVAEDHKINALYTLRSLEQRSLIQIERNGKLSYFRLHPIVAGYVLDRFIRAIFEDLMGQELQLFNDHALMKADAEEEIREFQRKHIVQPILERLRNYCKGLEKVDKYLSDSLNKFRDKNPYRRGYAGGNFVNLLVQLSEGKILFDKDFSQMTIWQAYLQKVQLREVSLNQCEIDRSVFTETISDVMAIAFSQQPFLAAGDANGVVHLWPTQANKASPQKCAQWAAHSSWVRAIAFVPETSRLVTGGDDNWLRLWQLPANHVPGLSQPTQIWQKRAHDWVHTVAVSPDGGIIASGGDDKITLYNTRDGALIHQFADLGEKPLSLQAQKNRIRALAFSPDGQWLASSGDDCIVRIWPVALLKSATEKTQPEKAKTEETHLQPMRLPGHSAMIHALCFSADSRLLVSGGADKTLRIWDVERGAVKKTFRRPFDCVRSLAISPNGLLASAGDDCQVMLWDLNTMKPIEDISTGRSRIWSVAFQQQGERLLLSAGGDKQTLILWEVTAETHAAETHAAETHQDTLAPSLTSVNVRLLRTYRGYTNGIRAVSFLSDSRMIGGGDSGELSVWDIEGDRKATLPFHQGRIWSIAVDFQNHRIASASDDHTIRLWSTQTGQCLTTLSGHNNWVRAVAFSRHGRSLVSCGDDGTIRVWTTASGFCRPPLAYSDAWIRSVAFNPTNSRYLISGGDDQVVRHWDIKKEKSHPLVQHEHRICSVAYSPDGQTVASGSDDTTVILCDVKSSEIIHRFANADLGIKSVAFSPDGQYLAAGGEDQLLYIWNLKDSDPEESCWVLSPLDYRGGSGGIRSVAFSPNGQHVIAGGLDGMIRMGDLSQMEDRSRQVLTPLFVRDRPYENTSIEEIKGLSRLQIANLVALGAVDKTQSLLS